MKLKFIQIGFAAMMLGSCKAPLNLAGVQTEKNIAIAADLPQDAQMTALIAPYKVEVESKMNTKLSHTKVELTKQGNNSALGGLLADFTFEGADSWARANGIPDGIDAALINVGGIRSTIGAGDILTKSVFEVMPFENEVVIMKMKGTDLRGLFDYYLRTKVNNPVSHLYIETQDGQSVKELINGKEVEPNKTYYIATSDYLALGGDSMFFFSKGEMISTGIKLRELFLDKFKANPEIEAPKDIRLNFK